MHETCELSCQPNGNPYHSPNGSSVNETVTVQYAANPVDIRSSPVPHPTIRRGESCEWNITDAAIVAMAHNCANLASLNIEYVV